MHVTVIIWPLLANVDDHKLLDPVCKAQYVPLDDVTSADVL